MPGSPGSGSQPEAPPAEAVSAKAGDHAAPHKPLWQRLAATTEGKILLAGILLALVYLGCVALTALWSKKLFLSLLSMTAGHIVAGRAAGMSIGYQADLGRLAVIAANMVIETFMVLIFYPLFVFSYQRLVVVRGLEGTIGRLRRAAEAHHKTVVRLGVPGLFLFVWFPMWMTGPLVGSIIGFIIGLRPIVNLPVVLGGTYVAIVSWGFVLHGVQEKLEALGPYVPLAFVGVLVLVGVIAHFAHAARNRGGGPAQGGKRAGV